MHAVFVGGYLIALASLISWQSPLQHRLHFHSFRQRPLGASLNLHEGTSLLEDTWPQLCSEESSHGRDPITPPNLVFFMPLKQHRLNNTIKFSFQLEIHPGPTGYISINALFSCFGVLSQAGRLPVWGLAPRILFFLLQWREGLSLTPLISLIIIAFHPSYTLTVTLCFRMLPLPKL